MDNKERDRLRSLLKRAGLPGLEIGDDGFPVPGLVIRYYRERMTYADNEGHIKHWTQADLAKRLHMSELSVRYMETRNTGLDSIERRRILATLLHIPPILLGLAAFDELEVMLHGERSTSLISHGSTRKNVSDDEIQLYKDALSVFRDAYDKRTLELPTIEAWITRIADSVAFVPECQQTELLAMLCEYHMIAARRYFHDIQNWSVATTHLTTTKQMANFIKRDDLRTLAYYYTGEMYLEQGNVSVARDELDIAVTLSKSTTPQIKGRALTYSALVHAMTAADLADNIYIQQCLQKAENCITPNIDVTSRMTFDTMRYLEDKADTLIVLKQYGKAAEALEEAEDILIFKQNAREYLSILQAECSIKQKRPEYGRAIVLLNNVLERNREYPRLYHVNYANRLYKLLATSSYGNAPEVADLGLAIREIQMKKRSI